MAKLKLNPHVAQDPPVTATDKEIQALQAEIVGWLTEAGLTDAAQKNWYGNAKGFLELTVDTAKEKPSILEVGKLNLPHDEGPSKHLHWWKVGGYLADAENTPESVPPDQPVGIVISTDEPGKVVPEFSRPVDIETRYKPNEGLRQLKTGEESLAMSRASYLFRWAGDRIHPSEWDARFARSSQVDLRPTGVDGRFWRFGWLTGLFSLRPLPFGDTNVPENYVGVTPEKYVADQIARASGGAPSGA